MFKVHQLINGIDLADGGAQRVVRDLHEGLMANGIQSHLVSLQACKSDQVPENTTSLGFASSYDPRCILELKRYAAKVAPGDIVHAHLFPASAHVALLSRCGYFSGKRVFTEHSTSNRRRETTIGQIIDSRVYSKFDKIIAISDGVEAELLSSRPVLKGNTVVVKNGCDLLFDAPIQRDPKKSPVTILSAGRLTDVKNYDLAIKALAQFDRSQFKYVICGEGPKREALEALAAEYELSDNIEFRGYVNDLSTDLAQADIFLIPSKWEGFGLAAVEAMNASLPIIASDVAGLNEVVGPDCAILIDPSDSQSIADALLALVGDPARRIEMGGKGFARCAQFDTRNFVENHITLYQNLAGETLS